MNTRQDVHPLDEISVIARVDEASARVFASAQGMFVSKRIHNVLIGLSREQQNEKFTSHGAVVFSAGTLLTAYHNQRG